MQRSDSHRLETRSLEIHCIAIGGTGMAPLACLLQRLGHRIRGSDGPLYPPMSTLLASAGIVPMEGYDPEHLTPPPDLVVVGNAVPRSNPEAAAVDRLALPRLSMPQAIARFLLAGRQPLVVAGTHGKTTTTAMASWVYTHCGADPGYLIGGMPLGMRQSFHIGTGSRFVIEGDEYNAAYFDRGPKFLHYRPHTLVLTSVEYDHADLYADHQDLLDAYRELVRLVPPDGLVVACGDAPAVRAVAQAARCAVRTYGLGHDNDVHPLEGVEVGPDGSRLRLADGNGEVREIHLQVPGAHNVSNALAVWAAACHDGLAPAAVAEALSAFGGVQRRLEVLGEVGGVAVVDDFAHHPTAVRASLGALRERFPGRRLTAVFEPRSLTAGRDLFFEAYVTAFHLADRVRLAPVFHHERLGAQRLDRASLVARLRASGVDASACSPEGDLVTWALDGVAPGDVLVTMSSGSFQGLPHKLLAALEDRF